MCIFFHKSLYCGCQFVAAQSREDTSCIFIVNHTYKWICDKCIKLPSETLNKRLEDITNNDNKIYISFINGWYRSPSSPTDYSNFIQNF